MRFSMLYSGEQNLSFKSCLVFYAGDSLKIQTYVFVLVRRVSTSGFSLTLADNVCRISQECSSLFHRSDLFVSWVFNVMHRLS